MTPSLAPVETRGRQSLGISGAPNYRAVADAVTERHTRGGIRGWKPQWSFARPLTERVTDP
jgi:hypothetical protein